MAVYLLKDLLDRFSEVASDGYRAVELFEEDADDSSAAYLNITAKDEDFSDVDYDPVEAFPENDENFERTVAVTFNDPCHEIRFSYKEVAELHHAVTNALEFYKDALKDKTLPRNIKEDIKSAEISARNLQAKLFKVVKRLPRK